MQDLIYVVPPYLLETCLGLSLQREVAQFDPDLAARNVFAPLESIFLRQPEHIQTPAGAFCNDLNVNEVIKEKLKDKFAVLGILGLTPGNNLTDDYILHLYDIFKGRLSLTLQSLPLEGNAVFPGSYPVNYGTGTNRLSSPILYHSNTTTASESSSAGSKNKKSVFEIPRVGDFILGQSAVESYPGSKRLAELSTCSLESLMAWAKQTSEHKYSFHPYLKIGPYAYLSPLPMYWTPLLVDKNLEYMERNLSMRVSTEDGYSSVHFKLNPDTPVSDDVPKKKRFFNFIANNEVHENSGVFYYELLVDQLATASSDYKPLIHFHDPLLSSGSSLFMNVGFIKRNVKFDKMPASATPGINVQSLDLKAVQNNIAFYNQNENNKKVDEDTLAFLGAEPGVALEGSFAVDFNKSCSYAPIKTNDGSFRTSTLNMNRRFSQINRQLPGEQETSRLDMDVPFVTRTHALERGKKRFKTDTIGCGVNFIDETIFITLNGVLIKTISSSELVNSNRHKDSIFLSDMKEKSLFPIMGFQLTDGLQAGTGAMPESTIRTNFGLKEFEFNISKYVKEVKAVNKEKLAAQVGEMTQVGAGIAATSSAIHDDDSFEKAVENINDDQGILNDFIKGYFIQEGYLDTLDAFKGDLSELIQETPKKNADTEDEDLINGSDAQSRSYVKNLILQQNFLEAIQYLEKNYGTRMSFDELSFDLKYQHYVKLVGKYLEKKFGNEFDFQQPSAKTKFNEEVVHFGQALLKRADKGTAQYEKITKLSGALLVRSKGELSQLSTAQKELDHQARNTQWLAEKANLMILELLNFEGESKLEKMINGVGVNIELLCHQNDNLYKLVNYERDFIDV